MNDRLGTSTTVQRWCLWCGPLALALWLGGFVFFADFLVPPHPSDSESEIAALYRDHDLEIKLGLVLTTSGAAFLGPFLMVIAVQMKRIEGRFSPLTYVQVGFGALFVIEFIIPVLVMQVAAYRADRSPEIVLALNDLGWILFVGMASTIVVEILLVGIAMLLDRREDPIYPRWAGYLSIWAALLIIPSNLCVFFKDGPLAWNGLFAWYVPISIFSVWVVVVTVLSFRALAHQERESLSDTELSSEELRGRFEAVVAELQNLKAAAGINR